MKPISTLGGLIFLLITPLTLYANPNLNFLLGLQQAQQQTHHPFPLRAIF